VIGVCSCVCIVRRWRCFVEEIVWGRLVVGAALPREVAVAERFAISRGVARECLRGLEERGLVTVRHGSATTVNARERWDLFDDFVLAAALASPIAVELLGEYLECRRIVEIGAAGLAAERAGGEQLAALEACWSRWRRRPASAIDGSASASFTRPMGRFIWR
jgi:DNA-binding FadR family transcriptional regulator